MVLRERCQCTGRRSFGAVLVWTLLLLLLANASVVHGFYIPGMSPKYYKGEDSVHMSVNSIRSNSDLFPKDYYSLPFCQPKTIVKSPENLGTILWGDREQSSLYVAQMLKQERCAVLPSCDPVKNSVDIRKAMPRFKFHIDRGYRGYITIDNLPVFSSDEAMLSRCKRPNLRVYQYERGYALGVPSWCSGNTTVNNHLHFRIAYNRNPTEPENAPEPTYMVVGLNVSAHSRKWNSTADCIGADGGHYASGPVITTDDILNGTTLLWTYSVEWTLNEDVLWATRWDAYFHTSVAGSVQSTHVVYIVASVVLILFISSAVATILLRALHRDFNRYNTEDPDDLQEETGWKLIHADVFRAPDRASLLSVFVGNGYQIMGMVSTVLLLALMGFLSPSRRGALLSCVLLTTVFMAILGGYVCGLLLQYFNCRAWKHVFLCGTAFPGTVCGIYVFTNIISKSHGATTAAPFTAILTVFVLWTMVSIPLTVLGASFAFHREPLSNPVRVGRLAREIPVQHVFNSPLFLLTVSPCLPLSTLLLELQFVLQALWAGQVYYVFGYLSIVSVLWLIVTGLVTVFQLYYVLCYENHRWWWLAFLTPSCLGAHMFLYTMYFLVTQLSLSGVASLMLYVLYMGTFSFAYGLATGAVGFTVGLMFVRAIYAQIKVD